jgi:hypothetical protein
MRTKEQKLEDLYRRSTKYELVACYPDGQIVLAGYCSHGKNNILSMLRKNGEQWANRIKADDMVTFAKDGQSAQLGKYKVYFSGRTQRKAIILGELPWFIDALPSQN